MGVATSCSIVNEEAQPAQEATGHHAINVLVGPTDEFVESNFLAEKLLTCI